MFYDIYIQHSENVYTFQNIILNKLKTVAKTCEKVLRLTWLNMFTNLVTKVKIETFKSQLKCHYNKTVIDYNFGSQKDEYTLKSAIYLGLTASVNITFSGR